MSVSELMTSINNRNTVSFTDHTVKCLSEKYFIDCIIVRNILEKRLARHNLKGLKNSVANCHIVVNHNCAYGKIVKIY